MKLKKIQEEFLTKIVGDIIKMSPKKTGGIFHSHPNNDLSFELFMQLIRNNGYTLVWNRSRSGSDDSFSLIAITPEGAQ